MSGNGSGGDGDPVVDAHVHAWGPDAEPYPWRADVLPPGWEGPYGHDRLVADMNAAGVDHAVVVTTPLYGRGPDANAYTLAAVDAHPGRLSAVGVVDWRPDPDGDRPSAADAVRAFLATDGAIGVRVHAALAYAEAPTEVDRTADWFRDDRLAPAFDAVGDAGGAVFVFPKAQQLRDVDALVARHPGTTFVIDHMAWPDDTTAPDGPPWTDVEALADRPNVAVKASSLPRSSTDGWPYRDLHGYVTRLVDWFGPERVMVGSDYPWMDDWAGYDDCLSWVAEVPELSARDRAFLRGRSFERVHGVDVG